MCIAKKPTAIALAPVEGDARVLQLDDKKTTVAGGFFI
jgi:hypothetical protein